jgi:CHAT domain-containing protein/tetratricopeptide (TPR) repeat protein
MSALTDAWHLRAWTPYGMLAVAFAGVVGAVPALAAQPIDALLATAKEHMARADPGAARAAIVDAWGRSAVVLAANAPSAEAVNLAYSVGRSAYELGDIATAYEAWERVLALRERTALDDDPGLRDVRICLAMAKAERGDHAGALVLREKVVAILARGVLRDEHEFQRERMRLATTLFKIGRVSDAHAMLEEVVDVLSGLRSDERRDRYLLDARINLASVRRSIGDLSGALELADQVHAECARATGDGDGRRLQFARVLLARALEAVGRFEDALELEQKAVAAYERTLPPDNPARLAAERSLAGTLLQLGDVVTALRLLERIFALQVQSLPDDHEDLQSTRFSLAAARSLLGDRRGALVLQEQVVAALSRRLPAEHQNVLRAKLNLALSRYRLGDIAGALELTEQVDAICERTLADDHPVRLVCWTNLGAQRLAIGDFEGALAAQERAVFGYRRRGVDDDGAALAARGSLAQLRVAMLDFGRALALQQDVLAAAERILPAGHTLLLSARADLGSTLFLLGERDRARELFHAALGDALLGVNRCIALLSPAAAEDARSRLPAVLSAILSLDADSVDGAVDMQAFEATLAARGHAELRARTTALVQRAARADPAARALLDAACTAHAGFERVYEQGGRDDPAHADRLRQARLALDAADQAVSRRMAEIPEVARILWRSSALELAARLPPGGAAILTATYERGFPLDPHGKPQPAASSVACFLLTGDGKLRRFDLAPAETLGREAHAFRFQLRASNVERVRITGRALAARLRTVLSALPADTRELLVCPDGALATIPWEALPFDDTRVLGDRYSITYGESLTVLDRPHGELHPPSMLALGGVDYDAPNGGESLLAETVALRSAGVVYAPLPGSLAEASDAAGQFSRAHPGLPSTVLRGTAASRAQLLRAAPTSRYIHLATHGEAAAEEHWRLGSGPGSQTGAVPHDRGLLARLVLAGANHDLQGSLDPCMLTASELARLDLSGCELAVLSACDANVGPRYFGEALTGLNRALQLAGARHTITSLWRVRDDGARTFFAAFYDRLFAAPAAGIGDALAAARTASKQQGFGPDVWACFVHYGTLATK